MSKQRTKKEKLRTNKRQEKREAVSGYSIQTSRLKTTNRGLINSQTEKQYFKADLTLALVLTMLALALEVILWLKLK